MSAVTLVLGACAQSPSSSPTSGAHVVSGAWDPDRALMPSDVTAPAPTGCAAVPRPDGWERTENRQPGTAFTIPADTGADAVVGYADRRSATCGDVVAVALSGPSSVVQIVAYRIGAYQGGIARPVWRSGDISVVPRPVPPLQPGTNLREAAWPDSVGVPIGASWPPGFYLMVPMIGRTAAGPAIPLVVRDDVDREQVLFAASTMTWNAYDDWSGYSLYRGPGATTAQLFASRSRVASFRRPLTGGGYHQLVSMDLPVVEELEQVAASTGIDVAYTTDVDLDQQPSQLLRHQELVVGGHSEYWTRREYDALAVARASGVNLLFLGANNLWWHTRLATTDGSIQPDREIVYREIEGDPTPHARPADFTLLWSQWPEHRDASAMLGGVHAAIAVHGGYQLLGAPAWLLAGTTLRPGTPLAPGSVLPGAVGNEADGYTPLGDNPRDLTVVAVGVLRGAHGPVTASAAYYVAGSGAAVFSAGSTDWACGLTNACFDQSVPAATSAALRILTRNLVVAFSQVRAGYTHPSAPGVVPSARVMLDRLAPGALGTYGAPGASEEGVVSSKLQAPTSGKP